jgi:hypothetical protein
MGLAAAGCWCGGERFWHDGGEGSIGGAGQVHGVLKACGLRRRLGPGWTGARAQAVAGLAVAVLLAVSAWAGRSRPGPAVIRHGDAAWRAFAAAGWTWGGDWSYPLDHMHFSANGL